MGQAVVIDHEATQKLLELLDRPKPKELVHSLGESLMEKLRLEFPDQVAAIEEADTYGHGDIGYRIKVKGQIDKIDDFLYNEEFKIALAHGVTILTFVSNGVSDSPDAN